MFGQTATFFILNNLSTFDGIISLDLLKQVDAAISLKESKLLIEGISETIHHHSCLNVNRTKVLDIEVPSVINASFLQIPKNNSKAFADPNESLPYNTAVIATIRTTDNKEVYSKLYPYPRGVEYFVTSEINELWKNGVIRKSRSPYNNPIWVVDKKGTDSSGNRNKRLVIDFRNLIKKNHRRQIPNAMQIDDSGTSG